MNKREVLKTLDISSLVSLAVATLLMFIFQFTGTLSLVKYSLVFYVTSFLLLTVLYSLRVHFAFSKETEGDLQFVEDKKQKALLITKLVLSCVALIFTFVVLVMY